MQIFNPQKNKYPRQLTEKKERAELIKIRKMKEFNQNLISKLLLRYPDLKYDPLVKV